jgi:hypothetical protein
LNLSQDQKKKWLSWGKSGVLALTAIYAYFFSEWLFFITRPSFMDLMPWLTKLSLLLFPALFLFALSLPIYLVLMAFSLLPFLSRFWKLFLWASAAVPAFFIASTALLLVDNFTYTVFKFGIVSTHDIQRGLYGFLFAVLFLGAWYWMFRILSRQTRKKRLNQSFKIQLITSSIVLLASIILGVGLYIEASHAANDLNITTKGAEVKRPNILWIGTDGLNAEHMSLYGYSRPTTPFLQEFSKSALMAENNFPNANETAGSMVSFFTGRLPTDTRMLYPPDILRGSASLLHFPGILQKEGYYNAEISVDFYADMTALNMQQSFVSINGRSAFGGRVYELTRRILPEDAAYLFSTINKRLTDRLMHIFYIRTMVNPYAEATQKLNTMSDRERIDMLMSLDLFQGSRDPLFVHVHMMGTHGAMYFTALNDTFSKGESPTADHDTDYYDDATLDFDHYMKEVVADLTQLGKLDNTIIIVYTDHGKDAVSNKRLPLLIRFPHGEFAGKITNNTQNLDIAPTLLDYMGIQKPDWMTGQSLIQGEPPVTRPIFSAYPGLTTHTDNGRKVIDTVNLKPPFYQFGTIGMVICQKWFSLDTTTLAWQSSNIDAYPTPCKADILPNDQQAQQIMIAQLKKNGFDTSTLEASFKK